MDVILIRISVLDYKTFKLQFANGRHLFHTMVSLPTTLVDESVVLLDNIPHPTQSTSLSCLANCYPPSEQL